MTTLDPADVLNALCAATSPSAALAAMVPELIVACSEIALAQSKEIHRSVLSRQRLREVRNLLNVARHLLEEFEQVGTLLHLAELMSRNALVCDSGFAVLLENTLKTSMATGDAERTSRLTEALGVRRYAEQMCGLLGSLFRQPDLLDSLLADGSEYSPLLESGFRAWLAERARLASRVDEDATASNSWCALELLEYGAWVASRAAVAQPSSAVSFPSPPTLSDRWWIEHGAFKLLQQLVERVRGGDLAWPDAQAEMVRALRNAPSLPDPRATSRSDALFARCVFAQGLVQTFDARWVKVGLEVFRETLAASGNIDRARRLTVALRYLHALLPNWLLSEDPRRELETAVTISDSALLEINEDANPRMFRDFLYVRARSRRELSKWDFALLPLAIKDFEQALSIRHVSFEREARARGLCDYASALRMLYPNESRCEERAEDLYREAVSLLHGGQLGVTRALVLLNLATLLNERRCGATWQHQERALEAIQRAFDSLDGRPEDKLGAHERQLRAALFLARGNIIRSRAFGDESSLKEEALSSYHSGLNSLDDGDGTELRGLLRHALGVLHSDFASSRSDLEIGVRNLDAAVADFSDNPIPRARALVARAPIQSLLQRQSEAHADIRAARAAFLAQGDIHGSATALFARGEILATHLDSGARKSAAESFLNAGAAFANAHDPARASGSLELGADILVELSSASHNQAFLGRSRKALLDAIALTEGLWGASFGIGPRLAIAEDLHRLWASLTWVLSQEDAEDSDATWCASLNAKAREILVARAEAQLDQPRSSGTAEPDELRRVVRLYDEALLKRAERVGPGENLLRESEELESASAEIEALVGSEARAWDEQRAAALANETSNWSGRNPQTVLCDFTVSEHGTVCFLWGSKVRVSDRVRTLPLRAENVRSWMNRWRAAYSDRASNEDQWEQATGALLAELGREIWTQLRDVLRDVEAVVVIPGLLSGLPVHSAMLATDGMASVGVVYSPHPSLALGSTVPIIAPLASAICVLSDPELVPTRQLRAARTEVAAVSRSLAEAGIDTLVVASVGVLAGTEVFKADGLALHPNVRCELGRPTPSWFV